MSAHVLLNLIIKRVGEKSKMRGLLKFAFQNAHFIFFRKKYLKKNICAYPT